MKAQEILKRAKFYIKCAAYGILKINAQSRVQVLLKSLS